MAALSASRPRSHDRAALTGRYPVSASTTIWDGAIVAIDTDGYAVPAADTASFEVVGIARKKADNSSGSDGDIDVYVDNLVLEEGLDATGLAQTQVGRVVSVSDDQTVTDAAAATNDVKVGRLMRLYSSGGKADVFVGDIAGTAA
ncbi:MAG: hypothetical protein ACPGVG_17825 [Mycobacterium sp.]